MTTTAAHDVAAVRLAGGAARDELRAVRMVWRRELIRFGRNRLRILTSLAQPVLFLFVLGTGLSTIVRGGPVTSVSNFRTFIFPGIVAMTVLFSAIFSAVSIVWDREFGFLREMLVAPSADRRWCSASAPAVRRSRPCRPSSSSCSRRWWAYRSQPRC